MINTIECRPSEAIEVILAFIDQKKAFFISGRPGVGKSQLVYAVAARLNGKVIDERLSQRTAADLGGLPALDHETGRTVFYPPAFLPKAEDGPTVLFIDELNMADEQTQGAALGLILERRIGDYALPDNCYIIAAGNRPEDGAPPFLPALNDRFIHLLVEPSAADWLTWASESGIDKAVMAYIHANPQDLVADEGAIGNNHAVTPSPRSWERVSDILKVKGASARVRRIAISGIVGDAVAAKFDLLAQELADMASVADILAASPRKRADLIPKSVNGLYALVFAMLASVNADTIGAIYDVLGDLPDLGNSHRNLPLDEVQTLGMTMISGRVMQKKLSSLVWNHPKFLAWDAKMNEASGTATTQSMVAA
jgi:MoxR-like ATPase